MSKKINETFIINDESTKVLADESATCQTIENVLSTDTIQVFGEAAGHSELANDSKLLLGEDVSYRLQNITQVSRQFMKHCRRKKLKTADVNKALEVMDVAPVYGYSSSDELPFVKCKEDLHCPQDNTVGLADLCLQNTSVTSETDTSISGKWLCIDGVTSASCNTPLYNVYLDYYQNIIQAILSSDKELVKISLKDLRTNSRISCLLPHFVHFISMEVKSPSHDASDVMKILYMLRAIVSNQHLNLHHYSHLQTLIDSILYCLLDTSIFINYPLSDHWTLRDYAGNLLAHTVQLWCNDENSLQSSVITRLHVALTDLAKPFSCHYGAVVGLIAFGHECIEDVLVADLSIYWNHLDLTLNDPSCANTQLMSDALKVYCALLLAVDLMFRYKIKIFKNKMKSTKFSIKSSENSLDNKNDLDLAFENIQNLYYEVSDYFGDTLAIRLPDIDTTAFFQPSKKEVDVSLADADSLKTGEELLEELMGSDESSRRTVPGLQEIEIDDVRRLKLARQKFAEQKRQFTQRKATKREHKREDNGHKKSKLEEEWLEDIRKYGKEIHKDDGDDSNHSSEGSASGQSEQSCTSDLSEGVKMNIKKSSKHFSF